MNESEPQVPALGTTREHRLRMSAPRAHSLQNFFEFEDGLINDFANARGHGCSSDFED